MMAQEILPLGYSAYNATTLDASYRNLDITGRVLIPGLTESPQVKALYYNTTTGEFTYDNSNTILQVYNDASFANVDISGNLQVNNITSINGNDLNIQTPDGLFRVNPDTDISCVIGRCSFDSRWSDHACFSHIDRAGQGSQALLQRTGGSTLLGGTADGIFPSIEFYTNEAGHSSIRWYIDGNGDFVGYGLPSYDIYCRKITYSTGSLGSDDRIKHNEVDISGLEIIRQLKPQKYQKTLEKYPIDYTGDISSEWSWESGLIAQDILKINDISYCVRDNSINGIYCLNYNDIFVYGLQATKELDIQLQEEKAKTATLQTQLQEEKAKTATLQTQLANLLTRVQALENN
jgi:hypothetical protein